MVLKDSSKTSFLDHQKPIFFKLIHYYKHIITVFYLLFEFESPIAHLLSTLLSNFNFAFTLVALLVACTSVFQTELTTSEK
jgi:hypothetical protein